MFISELIFITSAIIRKIQFDYSSNYYQFLIFQADGKENRKLQSIFLANFPIYTGHFTPDGDKVVATSRRKFFYVYDLLEGKVAKVPEIRGFLLYLSVCFSYLQILPRLLAIKALTFVRLFSASVTRIMMQ